MAPLGQNWEAFGNMLYGAMGAAVGLTETDLRAGSLAAHFALGEAGWNLSELKEELTVDQVSVVRGVRYVASGCDNKP
jgi:hypothetical protein